MDFQTTSTSQALRRASYFRGPTLVAAGMNGLKNLFPNILGLFLYRLAYQVKEM